MKNLLFTLGLIGMFQLVSAQNAVSDLEQTVQVTLSESEANNAKMLKGLTSGKLYKGESKTVFLISVTEENIKALTEELHALFPTCKVAVVEKSN